MAIERLPGYWLDEQLLLPVRGAVREAIERNLAGAPAGLLLGEKRRIPEEVREAFRGTGLAHALVVSGLHVGLVAGFFFFGFRFFRLSDRGSSAALLILVNWPESPWSLSFQLSFGAIWAIVALHKPLAVLFPEAWRREDNVVRHWIVSPLCASLAALPFAAVEVPRPGRLSRLLCDTLLAWAAIAR